MMSICRLTNEAETRSELRNDELTIPRLHVHFETAGGSKAAMAIPAFHNREVWDIVGFYLFAMIIFAFLHSVLSIVFVVEAVISDQGEPVPVHIPLSIDIPESYNGETVDPCTLSIAAPGCAYDLALTALSSQLVTYTPYTVGGVTFEPPNGTMGLPYWAMKHFSQQVESTHFEEEHRQYCLPVLDPHLITCKEEPFSQERGETNSSLIRYKKLDVYDKGYTGPQGHRVPQERIQWTGMFKIIMDYPSDVDVSHVKYRTNDEWQGVFLAKRHPRPSQIMTSVVTGTNDKKKGYASLLYELMYGVKPDVSSIPLGFKFVARCELSSIMYRDNYLSSWRKVDFTLKSGVLRANVTEERCPNPRGPDVSGFADLDFYLEGAGSVLSSSDGYSKLFNLNADLVGTGNLGHGSSVFQNMSRLDAVMNKIYDIVQTSWSQQTHEYALKNPNIYDKPVIMTDYPHRYVIRITWTPTTYIGLVFSLLITLNAYVLAYRWVRATYRFGFDAETWNLLRPVDLMAYSLAAYQDLIHDLNTKEHRRMVMHGKVRTLLRERPVWEGTKNLIGLVSSNATQGPVSPTNLSDSPVSPSVGKAEWPANVGVEGQADVKIEEKENQMEKWG